MSLGALRDFWASHPDSEQELREWAKIVRKANWRTFHDVRAELRSADQLGDGWVCFNIGRNNFRLIAKMAYEFKIVLVKFIGKHATCDRLLKTKNWKDTL